MYKHCCWIVLLISLSGCLPIASVGASAAISHASAGIIYRTFTAPPKQVRIAALQALTRMQIKLISDKMIEEGKIRQVTAESSKRSIEIQLEPISTNSTRMRVTAKNGLFLYDSATAEEVIAQTKISLG
jgi:hypothetical protein